LLKKIKIQNEGEIEKGSFGISIFVDKGDGSMWCESYIFFPYKRIPIIINPVFTTANTRSQNEPYQNLLKRGFLSCVVKFSTM
jgi:hypothetical protein